MPVSTVTCPIERPVGPEDAGAAGRADHMAGAPCGHQGEVTYLVLDGSASATAPSDLGPGTWRSDAAHLMRRAEQVPPAWRAEAREAVRQLATRTNTCRCGHPVTPLVGVQHLDPGCALDRSPTVLAKDRVGDVLTGIDRPPGGTCSVLRYALDAVEHDVARRRPEAAAFVVVSDFEFFDVDLPAVFDRLAALPGPVHAVVLGEQVPLYLERNAQITVTHVDAGSPPGLIAGTILSAAANARGSW